MVAKISMVLFLTKSFSSLMLENSSVLTSNTDSGVFVELFAALISSRFGRISADNETSFFSDCVMTFLWHLFVFVMLTGF